MKLSLFRVALLALVTFSVAADPSYKNVTQVPRQSNKKIYVHLMPWFETRQSSEDGNWGKIIVLHNITLVYFLFFKEFIGLWQTKIRS